MCSELLFISILFENLFGHFSSYSRFHNKLVAKFQFKARYFSVFPLTLYPRPAHEYFHWRHSFQFEHQQLRRFTSLSLHGFVRFATRTIPQTTVTAHHRHVAGGRRHVDKGCPIGTHYTQHLTRRQPSAESTDEDAFDTSLY